MGSLFGTPGKTKEQLDMERQQQREDQRLAREEEMKAQALRRRRSGRSSLISDGNEAGVKETLG